VVKGGKQPDAKPLKGFGGAGVLEIVVDFEGNAYRGRQTLDSKIAALGIDKHQFRH